MAKSDSQCNNPSLNEPSAKKRKQDEDETQKNAHTDFRKTKNLSKFSINVTYALDTRELRQKSYILAPQNVPIHYSTQSKTDDSRASGSTSKKRSDSDSEGDSDNEAHQPDGEEGEDDKSNTKMKLITIRQKRGAGRRKCTDPKEEREMQKNIQRITDYLQKWKNNREEWKFEKIRQMYLIQAMFDETKIDDELWPVALDYMNSIKGLARTRIIDLAKNEIAEVDEEIKDTKNTDLVNDIGYTRAREILQTLQ